MKHTITSSGSNANAITRPWMGANAIRADPTFKQRHSVIAPPSPPT